VRLLFGFSGSGGSLASMLALFERLGAVHVTDRYGSTEEIDVHLPINPDEPSSAHRGPAYRSEHTRRRLNETPHSSARP
jgi:hypothetical protein